MLRGVFAHFARGRGDVGSIGLKFVRLVEARKGNGLIRAMSGQAHYDGPGMTPRHPAFSLLLREPLPLVHVVISLTADGPLDKVDTLCVNAAESLKFAPMPLQKCGAHMTISTHDWLCRGPHFADLRT